MKLEKYFKFKHQRTKLEFKIIKLSLQQFRLNINNMLDH